MSNENKPPDKRRRRRRRRGGGRGEAAGRGDTPPAAQRPRSPSGSGEARSDGPRHADRTATATPPTLAAEVSAPATRAPPEERWGDDEDAPTPEVALKADLPADPGDDELDPATAACDRDRDRTRGIQNVVGVKFNSAGKIYRFDGADQRYHRGDDVIVETERGTRIGIVALPSVRRPHNAEPLRRILRRPSAADRRTAERNAERAAHALLQARELVRQRRMNIKLFRAEYTFGGTKLLLYFSSEKRIDFRDLARDLNRTLRARLELRQTGVRDEAKLVGGIGSCGLELCCTTFLPSFAPVSIKMAKDQGLVLNPHKVSGQCGRLKCCLVYEQDMYAHMRKGLPKLGKRVVVGERGEGRVTEVDVLRQRIRVSFGAGDVEVFPAGAVEPLFPSQPQGKPKK